MRNFKDICFVIKSINYSEADKIITFFGKERGKFSVLAKGVRRITSKNRGNVQTFSISKISYYQAQGLPILLETEEERIVDYKEINSDNARRVLFLLNKFLAEDAPNKKIFKALEVIIDKGVSDEYVNKFRVIFLNEEGMIGGTDNCSLCEEGGGDMYLNTIDFSFICLNCSRKMEKDNLIKVDKKIYSNSTFTQSLDNYIQRIYLDLG